VRTNKCLVLNADYSPLSIITWQKAIIWNMRYEDNPKYGVEIIDFYKNDYIHGTNNKNILSHVLQKLKGFSDVPNKA
jgi:hypothetical protein